jgi:hypothetical protein
MKTYFLGAVIGGLTGLGLIGCATDSATKPATTDPTQRTYTKSDLQNSGGQTTGEAVRKLEPAATVREF